jgi:NAD(P)-dependent dehydrogenase (short-subunit alcohol dehydrogenase family)
MSDVEDVIAPERVAVVTGAASGIGLAMTRRFVAEGMRVVMADVEEPALQAAADGITADGGEVVPVVTDVSDTAQVEALRDAALRQFGAVHLVCNNAGVGGPFGPVWEVTRGDLDWVLGVNLGGVLNGVRTFVPVLLEQDFGHVVNTSSIFGLVPFPAGVYAITKSAIIALSETLHLQLRLAGSAVGVTVLCPGAVRTNFMTSERNRPAGAGPETRVGEVAQTLMSGIASMPPGDEPSIVGDLVVDGIREGRFFVHTDPAWLGAIEAHARDIVAGAAPQLLTA